MQLDFNFRRAILFLKKDLLEIWRSAIIIILVVAGYTLLRSYLGGSYFIILQYDNISQPQQIIDYSSSLLMIGIPLLLIVTSRAFIELGDKTQNEHFLLLPVSTGEKFTVRLLTVSLLYPLAFMLCYSLIVLLIGVSIWLVYGINFEQIFGSVPLIQHFEFMGQIWYEIFFLAQAVFFLGAVWFKKMHWLRTILAVIIIVVTMGILLSLTDMLFFSGFNLDRGITIDFNWLASFLNYELRLFLSILLGLCCWWLAWVRFQEIQSSDAI